jgi:CheY-like chemotaxis protein
MSATILLVEDNEQNRYMATFLLEAAGYRVVHSPNGRQTLELALQHQPRLILMDIQMPEMDGYEAARLLLADSRVAGIPIIAVTSYAMAGDRERATRIGFCGYIEKPINPDTFIAEIRQFLVPRPEAMP